MREVPVLNAMLRLSGSLLLACEVVGNLFTEFAREHGVDVGVRGLW